MVINEDILRRDTIQLIKQIDQQIEEVKKAAADLGVPAHQLRDSNGGWVMAPLLLGKAQAYATLVHLQKK